MADSPQRPPALRGAAAAALFGAVLGLAVTSAETVAVIIAGGWPRLDWWQLIAASYVATCVLGQTSLWLASRAWRSLPMQEPADPVLLLGLLLFLHLLTTITQQAYLFVPWTHPFKVLVALYALAASLGVAVWLGRRRPIGFNAAELLIPLAIFTLVAEVRVHDVSHRWVVVAVVVTPLLVAATARIAAAGAGSKTATCLAAALVVGVPLALQLRHVPVRHTKHFVSEPQRPRGGGSARSPSILMIVLDTVRASSLSAYGYGRATTPNLDALARRGRLYSRFSIAGFASQASHSSLFTGLYPSRHGSASEQLTLGQTFNYPLAPGFRTLAEALAERGYLTAAVSANSERVGRRAGLDQGFAHFDARRPPEGVHPPLRARLNDRLRRLGWGGETTRRLAVPFREANEVVDAAIEWLDATGTAQPYFLFLNLMDAHAPYLPPPPFDSLWPSEPRPLDTADAPSPDELGQRLTAYDGSLRFLDREVGRLLEWLAKRPGFDDTWIFVLSDHGEAFGEHGLFAHESGGYEELVRVPLIVVPPADDATPIGVVRERLTQIVDIAPTILARLGEAIDEMDGIPFAQPRPASYIEVTPTFEMAQTSLVSGRVWIRGSLKLIVDADDDRELYDLDADPEERTDLAGLRPELVQMLEGELAAFVENLSERGLAPRQPQSVHRDQWRTLRALGYIK